MTTKYRLRLDAIIENWYGTQWEIEDLIDNLLDKIIKQGGKFESNLHSVEPIKTGKVCSRCGTVDCFMEGTER